MDAITLDQFAVFIAIVEEGSFAAAARKLHRAQSSITYAVQKLEEQSGVPLFDRSSYRAALTDEGQVLMPRIKRIMDDFSEFRVQAKGMTQGIEAELVLILDNFLPLSMFTHALAAFRQHFPTIHLRINSVWSQDVAGYLNRAQGNLGLTFHNQSHRSELDYRVVCDFDLVAVAAAEHPLSKITGKISRDTLREHMQIVVSNPNPDRSGPSFGIVGVNQWRVSETRLRHDLILAGLGWGSMPYPSVAAEIERGELAVLTPQEWDGSDRMPRLTCIVAQRKDAVLGPGARFLQHALATGRYDM